MKLPDSLRVSWSYKQARAKLVSQEADYISPRDPDKI